MVVEKFINLYASTCVQNHARYPYTGTIKDIIVRNEHSMQTNPTCKKKVFFIEKFDWLKYFHMILDTEKFIKSNA